MMVPKPFPFNRLFKRSLTASVKDIRLLLRERPDTEHELTLNRLLISSAILLYLVVAKLLGSEAASAALSVAALPVFLFEVFVAGLFIHILLFPGISPMRRFAGIIADTSMFSYGLYASGEAGAALFLVYFWAVLGNGFRFGVLYLSVAAVAAVGGFWIVFQTTPYWQNQPTVALGLVGALIVIPAYSAKLIRKLSEAKREAEEASQAKSLFLASMSHELRTPLNAIIALSDLLTQKRLAPEHHDMVRTIARSGRSLLSLIEAVLDLSRIEAGQTTVLSQKVDLPLLLNDVRSIIGVNAERKGLRITLHMDTGVPRFVMNDRRHLEEILLNLASNAVKFTETGHIRIGVSFERLDDGDVLRFEVSDTGIGIEPSAHARIFDRFTQADGTIMDRFGGTGLGLAIVKQLIRVMGGDIGVRSAPGEGSTFYFHLPTECVDDEAATPATLPPFVFMGRLDVLPESLRRLALPAQTTKEALRSLKAVQAETGRRALIVIDADTVGSSPRELATALLRSFGPRDEPVLALFSAEEATDGTLRYTPSLRDLFFCVIRAGEPADLVNLSALLTLDEAAAEDRIVPAAPEAAWRILIADDNKTNQMVMGKVLEMAGHSYEVVGDGEAAVERMLKGDLDVVLMDVNMPVMSGTEATKFYRFAGLGTDLIPIIGVTADATEEARQRCLEAGMAECLTKPIEPRRLLDAIAATLANSPPKRKPLPTPAAIEAALQTDQPVIDPVTFSALEKLGGSDFVDMLLNQFVEDSVTALSTLAAAVAEENVHGFRNSVHALRSAAANVGAARIYQMCLEWREINDPELASEGERHLHHLHDEFQRFKAEVQLRRAS